MSIKQQILDAFESVKNGGRVVINYDCHGKEATRAFNEVYGDLTKQGATLRLNAGKKMIMIGKSAVKRTASAPTPAPAPAPAPAPEPVVEEPVAEEPAPEPAPEPKKFNRFKSWSLDAKEDE